MSTPKKRRSAVEYARLRAEAEAQAAVERAAAADTPAEPTIRCTVRPANSYGGATAGQIVHVSAREYARVGHALVSDEDARLEREAVEAKAAEAKASATIRNAQFSRTAELYRESAEAARTTAFEVAAAQKARLELRAEEIKKALTATEGGSRVQV